MKHRTFLNDRIKDRDTLRKCTMSLVRAHGSHADAAIMYENVLGSILVHLPADVRDRLLVQLEKDTADANELTIVKTK